MTDDAMNWHPEIICDDCGKKWKRYVHLTSGIAADSAARVQGWTVWREKDGLERTTILCPKHRAQRGIPPRVTPLEETP
jgi:hypothetical protein